MLTLTVPAMLITAKIRAAGEISGGIITLDFTADRDSVRFFMFLMETSPKAVPKWIVRGLADFYAANQIQIPDTIYEGIVREVFSPALQKDQIPVIRSLVGTLIEEPGFIHGKRFLVIIAGYKEYNTSIKTYLIRAVEKSDNAGFMMTADEIFDYLD